MSLNVLLLKSSDQPPPSSSSSKTPPSDRYVHFLSQHQKQAEGEEATTGLSLALVKQINLIEFKFLNADRLQRRLADLLFNQFTKSSRLACKSVIVTSKQTVEAFDAAMFDHAAAPTTETVELRPEFQRLLTAGDHTVDDEDKLTVYCVGQATKDRFQALLRRLATAGHSVLSERLVTKVTSESDRAQASGKPHKQNSQELAKLIIADFEATSKAATSKDTGTDTELFAFYPCSAIRKDDLSEHFKRVQLSYDELFVYDTSPSEAGIEELRQSVVSLATTDTAVATCLVFFSPSGVEAAFGGQALLLTQRQLHFISVGPSTTAKLKAFVPAERVLEMSEPSPQALVQLLKSL